MLWCYPFIGVTLLTHKKYSENHGRNSELLRYRSFIDTFSNWLAKNLKYFYQTLIGWFKLVVQKIFSIISIFIRRKYTYSVDIYAESVTHLVYYHCIHLEDHTLLYLSFILVYTYLHYFCNQHLLFITYHLMYFLW